MPAIDAFTIARLPKLIFGDGALAQLPAEARAFGRRALIITGARSLRATGHWPRLLERLRDAGLEWDELAVDGEPSPDLVDAAVAAHAGRQIDVVVGLGGGSAIDAAKAIAGMLGHRHSVVEHLEGVGPERPYAGPAVPLIAVPTTAGTGSEATKNAVLSRPGAHGFKKSFRDEQLVARVAIVDPTLLASCPPAIIAANGMDAFTQLLESYTSAKANPLTDALAWSGLEAFAAGFFHAWRGGSDAATAAARGRLAYAATISGICLAQTGLGAVHGLASPLGAWFPIPHGLCCGTLVAAVTAVNIRALTERAPGHPALAKYDRVAALIEGSGADAAAGEGHAAGLDRLVATLAAWTERLGLARLGSFGVTAGDVDRLVAESRGSSMRTNPIVLTDAEVGEIVAARL
jgi:alcohol dehydrogenase